MVAERDLELIDDYVTNRMSPTDRIDFEKRVSQNTELQTAIKIQQGIIESIKKARFTELKSSLNNITIPSATSISIGAKTVIGLSISALVATVFFFAFYHPNTDTSQLASDSSYQIQKTDSLQATGKIDLLINDQEVTSMPHNPILSDKVKTPRKKNIHEPLPVTKPSIDVFDPSKELETESVPVSENDNDSTPESLAGGSSTIQVAIDSTSKRHTFHYKLVNDQLTLYGPFEHNLFEILEFFSTEKRTAFLFHKNSYYYIKNSEKTTALLPVKDPALLNKLRKLRIGK